MQKRKAYKTSKTSRGWEIKAPSQFLYSTKLLQKRNSVTPLKFQQGDPMTSYYSTINIQDSRIMRGMLKNKSRTYPTAPVGEYVQGTQ
jgi:hypothetical protein